jgi:hypothetical protein
LADEMARVEPQHFYPTPQSRLASARPNFKFVPRFGEGLRGFDDRGDLVVWNGLNLAARSVSRSEMAVVDSELADPPSDGFIVASARDYSQ